MKQAIAGVTNPDEREATIMTVWPSVAAMSLFGIPLGELMGRLFSIKSGAYIFTLGNLFCLLSIPLAIVLYFKRIGPFVATRYRVTNRRVVVERGMSAKEERSLPLDQFDRIEIQVSPGQAWYRAGNLEFWSKDVQKFVLEGVSRPEAFRQVCLKARHGYVGVQSALKQQPVLV